MRLIVGLATCLVLTVSACTTNPATGRSQLNLLPREREIALGEEAMPQLVQSYGGAYASAEAQSYLTEIGMRMAALTESDYPTLPWEFTLLDSDEINAFALPGGKVFVSRGLVAELEDEAMLSTVVGHEIGHVTAQHIDERISRQMLVTGAAIAAGVAAQESDEQWVREVVPVVVGVGAAGYLLSFSREQELEADELGMRYAARAGYEPSGLLGVLETLMAARQGAQQLEIFSTHPNPETRIERAQRRLTEEYRDFSGVRNQERFRRQFSQLIAETRARPASSRLAAGGWCGVCEADQSSEARAAATAE